LEFRPWGYISTYDLPLASTLFGIALIEVYALEMIVPSRAYHNLVMACRQFLVGRLDESDFGWIIRRDDLVSF